MFSLKTKARVPLNTRAFFNLPIKELNRDDVFFL